MLSNKVAALKNSFFKKSLSTLVVRSFPSLARFSLVSRQKFCTQNNISEKEAMEMVEAGVFEVLKTAAKCKHNKLTRTASFEELGFDSLDQVELVAAMEEKFGVDISDDDSLKIQSVLDAIQIMHTAYVKAKANVGTEVKEQGEAGVASKEESGDKH